MRVLQWAFPLLTSQGGREEFILDLTHSLTEHDVAVAMVHDSGESSVDGNPFTLPSGVDRFPLSFTQIEAGTEEDGRVSTLALLENFVEQFSPDVIHFHTPGGKDIPLLKSVAALTGAPVIYTEHESPSHRVEPARRSRALIGSFVDYVVCPSESSRRQLLSLFPTWDSRTTVIPNGVSRSVDKKSTTPGLVYGSGRHSPEKGWGVLVAAWSIVNEFVPEARLVLSGSGGQTPTLKKMVSHYGLDQSVLFTGWLPRDENRQRAAEAEVVVVPSTWSEPFGLVVIEAALSGTPSIVSRSGALEEIVHHNVTGIHVESGDVAGLAMALVKVLRDKPLRESLGEQARELAQDRFTMQKCVEAHIALFESARNARKA